MTSSCLPGYIAVQSADRAISVSRAEQYASMKEAATEAFRHIPPKRRLTFGELHGIIFQKTELFSSLILISYENSTVRPQRAFMANDIETRNTVTNIFKIRIREDRIRVVLRLVVQVGLETFRPIRILTSQTFTKTSEIEEYFRPTQLTFEAFSFI
jgi:hypothetical protein